MQVNFEASSGTSVLTCPEPAGCTFLAAEPSMRQEPSALGVINPNLIDNVQRLSLSTLLFEVLTAAQPLFPGALLAALACCLGAST